MSVFSILALFVMRMTQTTAALLPAGMEIKWHGCCMIPGLNAEFEALDDLGAIVFLSVFLDYMAFFYHTLWSLDSS